MGTPAPRVIADIEPKMLKATLRKSDSPDALKEIGECLDFARRMVGWTLDQLARELEKDPRQVRRWIAGEGNERLPLHVVFAVEPLRVPFVIALSRLVGEECEEETTLRFRRRA